MVSKLAGSRGLHLATSASDESSATGKMSEDLLSRFFVPKEGVSVTSLARAYLLCFEIFNAMGCVNSKPIVSRRCIKEI